MHRILVFHRSGTVQRRILLAVAGIVALTFALSIWYRGIASATPIQFLGDVPPVTFIKLDMAPRLSRQPIRGDRVPDGVAVGYLRWNDGRPASRATYRVAGVTLPIYELTLLDAKAPLTYVPFVTDEKYREATLIDGTREYRIKLPVDTSFGSPILPVSEAKVGPWTIFLKPKPWVASAQPYLVEMSAKGPTPATLWFYAPHSFYLGKGQTRVVQLSAQELRGEMYEVEPQPLKLRALKGRLVDESGKVLYEASGRRSPGYAGFRIADRWFARGFHVNDERTANLNEVPALRSGRAVDAVGYRILKTYPYELHPEIPPILQTLRD